MMVLDHIKIVSDRAGFQFMDERHQAYHTENLQLSIVVANTEIPDGACPVCVRELDLHSFSRSPVPCHELLDVRSELGVLRIDLDEAGTWNEEI